MPTDLAKVKELFLAVLEQPVSERSSYLDSACAGDSALRQQIESMLESHENSGELLSRSPAEMMADSGSTGDDATSAFPQQPGQSATAGGQADSVMDDLTFLAPSSKPGYLGRLGHYEMQQVIGKGGFGIVLKAFDEKLHRAVRGGDYLNLSWVSRPAARIGVPANQSGAGNGFRVVIVGKKLLATAGNVNNHVAVASAL